MRRLVLICAVFLPALCFAQPASNEASGPVPGSQSLTDDQITAYQQSAIQKLQDFYDLLGAMSNPAYQKQLKEDAANQAKQLFYNGDCSIDGQIFKTYIDSCLNLKNGLQWQAVNVKVKEKMKAKSDVLDNEYYEGVLSFTLLTGAEVKQKYAYVMLAKFRKSSGPSGKEVWTAFICDIR